jgi:hypothetical protein
LLAVSVERGHGRLRLRISAGRPSPFGDEADASHGDG